MYRGVVGRRDQGAWPGWRGFIVFILVVLALIAIVLIGPVIFQYAATLQVRFNPEILPWWGWFLAGAATWFFINTFGLPDPWSVWLALRENGLVALLPFGILFLLVGGWNLMVGAWLVFFEAISRLQISGYVWVAVVAGLILSIPGAIVLRRRRRGGS